MTITCGSSGGPATPATVPNNVYSDHSYNGTPAQSLSAGAWSQVELNTVLATYQMDAGNDIAVDTAVYDHTVSEDGIYHLHGNVRFQYPAADIDEVALELRVNGTAVARTRDNRQDIAGLISSVSGWVTHVTAHRLLTAGDKVTLWMKQENATSAVIPIQNQPQYAHLVTSRIASVGTCSGGATAQDIACGGGGGGGAPIVARSKIETMTLKPTVDYGTSTDGSPWPEVSSGDWTITDHIGGNGAGGKYISHSGAGFSLSAPGILIYRFVVETGLTTSGKNIDFVEGNNTYFHQVRRVRPNGSVNMPWGYVALQGSFGVDAAAFEFQERWIYTNADIKAAGSRLYLTFIPR